MATDVSVSIDERTPPESQTGGQNSRNAWIVALATLVALIPSSASIVLYAQGYFVEPMTREFGWSRTQVVSAVSISTAAIALINPLIGYWGDRYGVRPVLAIGVIVFGFSMMSLSLLDGSPIQYWLLTILVGLSAVVQSPLLYCKAIASWAPRPMRGKALAVGVSGLPLGNFLIPAVTLWLITEYGWRGGRVGLGLLILTTLPLILLLINETPAARAESRAAIRRGGGLLGGLGQLARDPTCRKLFLMLAIGGMTLNGLVASLIPMMGDGGFSLTVATTCITVMAAAGAVGRLASGWLLDRFQTPRIGILWFGMGAAGVALIATASGEAQLLFASVLVGLAAGAEVELAAYYATRFFGMARFGESFGVLSSGFSFGTAAGSLAFGISFDMTGSYMVALLVSVVLLLVACWAIFSLPPYPEGDGYGH